MADKKAKKKTERKPKKKQRRSFRPRIDIIAAATYWFVRLVLLLVDWFMR